jgi:tRNA A-37 threonylcarbamoyl transferase component Bud32
LLNRIIIPASVELLASDCFRDWRSLTVVTFDRGSRLKEIGQWAFRDCSSLRAFELPQFVEVILSNAFANCRNLSEFCVPRDSRLQRIESESFQGCYALTYFHIPASIKFIGSEVFPQSCKFEVGRGNHENAVREWCVRFLLNPRSVLYLSSLSEPSEQHFELHRFHEVGRIGSGAQGEVRRYQDSTSGAVIAVKRVSLTEHGVMDRNVSERVLREVKSLMKFRHPSIVPLLGYDLQLDSRLLLIAMPYIGPYSLKSVLESPQEHAWLTLTAKTIIIVGIVIGMYFVHCGGIIHRDLKPANVLLDPISHYPTIADFGWSREGGDNDRITEGRVAPLDMAHDMNLTMTATGYAGSPLYMAPEVMILGGHYSYEADVFSFGIVLYGIVAGKQPCQGVEAAPNPVSELCAKVRSGAREEIPDTVEPFVAGLIRRCWAGDPGLRPTSLGIFNELRANRFKVFRTVDPQAVEHYLLSLP